MTTSPLMRQALEAARTVRGYTAPNPWVGAIVAREGHVIATGATAPPGGPHAEAAALEGIDAREATVYVTLEPCSPFPGKRTRPCVDALIEAGVSRVVVALEDSDPNVRGRGLRLLREAGIEVEVGDGRDDAANLLRPYLKHRETAQPYVIAKFASSLDGRAAAATGDSKWITGPAARDAGHQQRAWVDVVMVGSGTVLADDPQLTARPGGELVKRQPVRVILDARGRTPPEARLFDSGGPVLIATTAGASDRWKEAMVERGAQIVECEDAEDGGVNLDQLLLGLGGRGVLSVWAEGGGTVLGSLLDAGHINEVWAFLAPMVIGGAGIPAVGGHGADYVAHALTLSSVETDRLDSDLLVRGFTGAWTPAALI